MGGSGEGIVGREGWITSGGYQILVIDGGRRVGCDDKAKG